MPNYLDDRELYYEMVISKGKGKLTSRSQELLILIAQNTIRKKERNYRTSDDRNDCIQQGLLHLFQNWKNFNPQKFDSAFPYFTEIFKRGLADGMNVINNKKSYNEDKIRMISIDRANEGKGLHNI
jgi:hypothetical protein